MKELLYKMFGHKSLSKEEAKQVLLNISDGRYNDSQLSAFMTVFLMRSITTEELAGFREAILERRVIVDLDCHDAVREGMEKIRSIFLRRLVLWWPEQATGL